MVIVCCYKRLQNCEEKKVSVDQENGNASTVNNTGHV